MNETGIDPDMIRGYKCRICGCGTTRDEAFKVKDLECDCLDCSTKNRR